MYSELACSRCATRLSLQGNSKTQAIKLGLIVTPEYHELADCIRQLAYVISVLGG